MSGRTVSCAIPSRRVHINDPSQLPHEYSATPGGTLFSTTPGGTRIIYERNFLLQMRNSPLTKTPPKNLPVIPGVTTQATAKRAENKTIPEHEETPKAQEEKRKPKQDDDDQQFQMDI